MKLQPYALHALAHRIIVIGQAPCAAGEQAHARARLREQPVVANNGEYSVGDRRAELQQLAAQFEIRVGGQSACLKVSDER